jgi:cytochrome c556
MRTLVFVLVAASAAASAQAPSPTTESPVRRVGTMSELMVTILKPASDAIFYVETRTPADGDAWTLLQGQALMVAETANLLMLPGRARDEKQWLADARLMREAGEAAFTAAKTRRVEEVAAVNDQLYASCVTCHRHYRPGYGDP